MFKQGAIVCPKQKIMLETYSKANYSDRSLTEVAITQPGVMQYTVYVKKSCHCVSDIMIVADDKVVSERITVPFSRLCLCIALYTISYIRYVCNTRL